MENKVYTVRKFTKDDECVWDDFVEKKSVNGTFLQTRRFLNYHPLERFEDCSYMVYDSKGNLVTVVPACKTTEDNKTVLFSHKGSTFGGLIVDIKNYKVEKINNIIDALERKAREDSIDKIVYKITANPFALKSSELLEYCLYYKGYTDYKELSLLVDFNLCGENFKKNLAQGKRTNVTNCEKKGCICRPLRQDFEIENFYAILCANLQKYQVKPVHTIEELKEFLHERLKNEVGFYGIFLDEQMIAGGMLFYFDKVKVVHTQYLCAMPEYNALSPMTYLYYSLMVEMCKKGYKKITWGIVTEDMGRYLNMGLTKSKEGYGGEYSVNHTFIKFI